MDMNWRKSSYSSGSSGNCVETADTGGIIFVRDTTDRGGATLAFSASTWQEFTGRLR
jgi:hypothetical protein